jgi:hypothetical protein
MKHDDLNADIDTVMYKLICALHEEKDKSEKFLVAAGILRIVNSNLIYGSIVVHTLLMSFPPDKETDTKEIIVSLIYEIICAIKHRLKDNEHIKPFLMPELTKLLTDKDISQHAISRVKDVIEIINKQTDE